MKFSLSDTNNIKFLIIFKKALECKTQIFELFSRNLIQMWINQKMEKFKLNLIKLV